MIKTRSKFQAFVLTGILSTFQYVHAQTTSSLDTITAQAFDMGKMWTFDIAPKDYINKTYNLDVDQKWFDKAQLGALRFSTFCSASFVSPTGLIMTNHHCSREAGVAVQKDGEDFNSNGFYAVKAMDERQIPDLFVDQLIKIEDITERIQAIEEQGESNEEKLALRDQGLENLIEEYSQKSGWKDLEIESVTLYHGGRYSLYGFKRYTDIRLVFMPELELGFFGGDPDNFTYPRYNLDFTFFRAYNEAGKPVNTPEYFKFNPKGAQENEPVFVIGNPGSTGRLLTVEELEMDRDFKLPFLVEALKNRSKVLSNYNTTAKSDSITNEIFSYENGVKSFGGQLKGMRDPELMARKKSFEKQFKTTVGNNPKLAPNLAIWDTLSNEIGTLRDSQSAIMLFQNNPVFRGELLVFAQQLVDYAFILGTSPTRANEVKEMLRAFTPKIKELEVGTLAMHIKEATGFLKKDDEYTEEFYKSGLSFEQYAEKLYSTSKLKEEQFVNELISKGSKAIMQSNDPLLELAKISQPRFLAAVFAARTAHTQLEVYQSKLGRLVFEVYGAAIPPDATMSLRINDGVVKGFEYNGTEAPSNTTFYGLYDRYYSHKGKFPWSLPTRWQNPPKELLSQPLNFVSTNDIIGGNSGSPIVNSKLEVVGLAFDGNMESLPGYFIFAPDKGNRTVSVHAGGIVAALEHIYKAKRLLTELVP